MATTTVYTSNDGRAYYGLASTPWSQASWDTVHDASTSTGADAIAIGGYASVIFRTSLTGYLQRAFTPFDTSAIPDTDAISAGNVYLYGCVGQTVNDFSENVYGVESTCATNGITTADYSKAGATNNPTVLTSKAMADWATGAYNTMALNATGLTKISKTGFTKLAWRAQHDTDDTYYDATAGAKNSQVVFYLSAETGTSKDPYIVVTHAPAGAGNIKKINGVLWANVKKINGIPVANIKKVNGIAAK